MVVFQVGVNPFKLWKTVIGPALHLTQI